MSDTLGETAPDQPDGPTAPSTQQAYLFVVFECDRPLSGGACYPLGEVDRVTIGRGESRVAEQVGARLDLRLPSKLLSADHVRLCQAPGGWGIEDVGSRNGTFVNQQRITRQPLRDGDLIEIGRVILRFRVLPTIGERAGAAGLAAVRPPGFGTLLPPLAVQLHDLARIAPSPLQVLLLGETGTGKEVVARGLHTLSGRPGPLIAVNCGALSGTLLESQLFGHVRGSFTGALRDEVGFVRASDHGTLFLDEIGDLPLASQAALLRVLQEREVVPVGSAHPIKVDLRIVAATHRQLDLLAARGEFRADLFARLSGHLHYLTPLRERREDLGLLVADLLAGLVPEDRTLRFSPEAGRALVASEWPFNIRQLEQSLARAVTLAEDGVIHARHLVVAAPQREPGEPPPDRADRAPGATSGPSEAELRGLLERSRGNVSEVARALGCSRIQVHRWMQRHALDPDSFRQ